MAAGPSKVAKPDQDELDMMSDIMNTGGAGAMKTEEEFEQKKKK